MTGTVEQEHVNYNFIQLMCQEVVAKNVAHLGEPDFLRKSFERIRIHLGIDQVEMMHRINKYVEEKFNPATATDIQAAKHNICKELERPTMTWNVFVKGLEILQLPA